MSPFLLRHSEARFNGRSSRFARFERTPSRLQPDLGLELGALSMWCRGFGVLAGRPHFHCPPRSIYSFWDRTNTRTWTWKRTRGLLWPGNSEDLPELCLVNIFGSLLFLIRKLAKGHTYSGAEEWDFVSQIAFKFWLEFWASPWFLVYFLCFVLLVIYVFVLGRSVGQAVDEWNRL